MQRTGLYNESSHASLLTLPQAKVGLEVASTADIRSADTRFLVSGVEQKAIFAEYSWAELKALSQAIAAAENDQKGLLIAWEYHLVDKYGLLKVDERSLVLFDALPASV